MIRRMMINILCICVLLTAMGCNSNREEQTGLDIPTSGYDIETGNEVLSEDGRESADVTESDREEQTESDILASGSDTETENEVLSEDGRESADVTENEQEGQAKLPECYEELITTATECIEGNVEEEFEDYDYDFSYIIYVYGAYEGASMGLGYLIEDIDGNGTEELIFGENGSGAWDGVIYDLYTIYDGELVHVFEGGERDRYYLCENGMISNEGSGGAAVSVSAYYVFEGTELHLVEALLYNGWDSPDNPWFYSTQTNNYYDLENAEPINEDQARAIEEKYVYAHPTFIPFVEE